MEILHAIYVWFHNQNWFVLSFAIVGWLNVIVAGARVMGWTKLAEFCGKLEDAIKAMVDAALNKNKNGVQDVNKPSINSDSAKSLN